MSRYEEPKEVQTTREYGRSVLSCEIFVSDEDLKSIGVKPKTVSDEELIDVADKLAEIMQETAYKDCLQKALSEVRESN